MTDVVLLRGFISMGWIKKLLRRNIKQMSSLIFGMEHSLKTRLINVEARRAPSICYQCNEGPFSWNQCDHMSLQPFPILLLMMNIAHLLLQKENQKEDRAVGIPLLDDILCDNLICKGSVVYPCIGEDDTSSLCWLPWCGWTRWSSEFGESIFGNVEIWDDKKMVMKRQKSMQDIFKAHRSHYDTRLRKRRQSLPGLEEDSVELSTWGVSLFLSCLTWIYHHHHPHIHIHPCPHPDKCTWYQSSPQPSSRWKPDSSSGWHRAQCSREEGGKGRPRPGCWWLLCSCPGSLPQVHSSRRTTCGWRTSPSLLFHALLPPSSLCLTTSSSLQPSWSWIVKRLTKKLVIFWTLWFCCLWYLVRRQGAST